MSPEFYVHNLGCKLNRVESDTLGAALLAAGASAVARDEAQVVIVNTCTVTAEAEAKTRKAIRQALASPAAPWVIATGCAIAIDTAGYQALGSRVIAEPDRLQAQSHALNLLGLSDVSAATATPSLSFPANGQESLRTQSATPPQDATATPSLSFPANGQESLRTQSATPPQERAARHAASRSRLGIKIQDGCDGICSYCIVRIARGPARSIPLAQVREQARAAERQGFRELVLTGVNIGSYNDGGRHFTQLVAELLNTTTETRIRLSSLEPQHVDDELLELMAASNGHLCAHLHLPLQSGCDRTLEAMARPYDTAFFAQRVARARQLMPRLSLTTDVIVGFPGESDEDFEASRSFCERMGFARMHVFRYSARPQTPAATLPDQVSSQASAARSAVLRALATRLQQRDAEARVGNREQVLVERPGRGTSESYHHVAVPTDAQIGTLVSVQFAGYRDTLLQATMCHENG